jgi:hypothetical protein
MKVARGVETIVGPDLLEPNALPFAAHLDFDAGGEVVDVA